MPVEKNDVDKAVIEFCKEVIKEPLLYFSESDLHVLLIEKLFNKIPTLQTKLYQTNVHRGRESKTCYQTRLVHREYGCGGKRRVDLAIFNENDIKKINTANLTIDSMYNYLPIDYCFELGTEKSGLDTTEKHAKSDIDKLKKSQTCGYLIHIFRDTTVFPSKTQERNVTEQELKDKFKNVFLRITDTIPSNVKIIAILLSSFRQQSKTHGKCNIFDKETRHWKRVNLSDVEDILKKQLR